MNLDFYGLKVRINFGISCFLGLLHSSFSTKERLVLSGEVLMGSRNYPQQLGLGSGRSAGSSRRGKKNNMEKPKQPQRGLGVAQLEKIILQNQMMGSYPSPLDCDLEKVDNGQVQMGCPPSPSSSSVATPSSSLFDLRPNSVIGFGDTAVTATRYSAYHSFFHQAVRPTTTLPLLEPSMETSSYHDEQCNSIGSISQNSCDSQELDLELKL
ncbi:protein SPEAR1-like isoform X2 [Musa acuminata AAA Group]|uniref:protein SPEAR1-like isoform X2 n=1 Tax=Musa acuminata AAA Group TaxID=214697 RepID=UPI0031CE3917